MPPDNRPKRSDAPDEPRDSTDRRGDFTVFNTTHQIIRTTAKDGKTMLEFAPKSRTRFKEDDVTDELKSHFRSGVLERESTSDTE